MYVLKRGEILKVYLMAISRGTPTLFFS